LFAEKMAKEDPTYLVAKLDAIKEEKIASSFPV